MHLNRSWTLMGSSSKSGSRKGKMRGLGKGKRSLQLSEVLCVVWGGNTLGYMRARLDCRVLMTEHPYMSETTRTRRDLGSTSVVQAIGHGEWGARVVDPGDRGELGWLRAGPGSPSGWGGEYVHHGASHWNHHWTQRCHGWWVLRQVVHTPGQALQGHRRERTRQLAIL